MAKKMKPSIYGYHALYKNEKINIDVKDMQEKVNKTYLEKIEEINDKIKNAYKKDEEHGAFLKKLYMVTEKTDVVLLKYIHKKLIEEEPVIVKKSDLAQMIIVTKILIELSFKLIVVISNKPKLVNKLVNGISLLRFDLVPDIWLEVYSKHVLPIVSEIFTEVGDDLDNKFEKTIKKLYL